MKPKMDDEGEMDLQQIQESLSNLLGVTYDAVFDYVGSSSSDLSDWAYNQLSDMVELPDGYSLTPTIRIPNAGEFFLDISTLVNEERVVVYKALDVVTNVNLILDSDPALVKSSAESQPLADNAFDFFLCMLQGGIALYRGTVVRLLVPAVDTSDRVVIVSAGKFQVVNINELKHVNDVLDAGMAIPKTNLLPPTSGKGLPRPKKNKYSNRFNIKFDDEDSD